MCGSSPVLCHQVSVQVGGSWSPAEGVGCAVNPSSGRTALGTEPRGPARGCQHGWELLCARSGWQMSPTAAFDGDRTNLTLLKGCWARGGGLAQLNKVGFFAGQFPMDVAQLHRLQLALCSPEALTKAELSLRTGKWAISAWTSTVGMVRQAERCPSPSSSSPGPSLPPPHPSDHPSRQCSRRFRTLHAAGLAAARHPVTLSLHLGEALLFTLTAV